VLAIDEPSDDEREDRDDAALLDLQLIKEVGSREDPDALAAFERADFGEEVKEVFQTARGRLGWMTPFGEAPNPTPDRRELRDERQQSSSASRRTSGGNSDLVSTMREILGRQPKEYGKHQEYPKFRGDDASTVTDFYLHCMRVKFVFEQNSVPEARRLFQGGHAWVKGSPAKDAYELYTMEQAEAIGDGRSNARLWRGACEYVRRTLYGAETDSLDKYARDFLRQARWTGNEHPASFYKDFVRHMALCKDELTVNQARRFFVDALPREYWSCVSQSITTVPPAYEAMVERYHRIRKDAQKQATSKRSEEPVKNMGVAPMSTENEPASEGEADQESDTGHGRKRSAHSHGQTKRGKRFKNQDPIEHDLDARVAALVRQQVNTSVGRLRREMQPWQQQQQPQRQRQQQQQQQKQPSPYQPQQPSGNQGRERCCEKHRFLANAETKCYACQGFGHYAGHCSSSSGNAPATPTAQPGTAFRARDF
jgi:hypothetical protein